MPNENITMHASRLTILLAAAQRLYDRDKATILVATALMEKLAQEEDMEAALERFEGSAFGTDDESDELENLGRSLALDDLKSGWPPARREAKPHTIAARSPTYQEPIPQIPVQTTTHPRPNPGLVISSVFLYCIVWYE